MNKLRKIVSGGQTGADRAGLDVAIWHDFPYGGWCPKGRRSEDGTIPSQYQLIESPQRNYLQRTEWNVRDSDGTLILTLGAALTGGSLRTAEFAKKHKKPWLHVARAGNYNSEEMILRFVSEHEIETLNVAGSRESKEPGLHEWVKKVLTNALFWSQAHPGMLGGPGEG